MKQHLEGLQFQRVVAGFAPDAQRDDSARREQIERRMREVGLLIVSGTILNADGRCFLHERIIVLAPPGVG